MDSIANLVQVTVDPNGNYDDTSTSIDLIAADGVKLPATPFNVTWWNETDYPNPAKDPGKEIVRVTAISTDTLTITRAQEGTDANDKNVLGKTYAMALGPTKKTVDDLVALLGDVFGSGIAVLVIPDETRMRLRFSGARFLQLDDNTIELQSTDVKAGDVEGEGNSSFFFLDDTNGRFILNNLDLATSQIQSATLAVGTLAGKLKITNADGSVVRYIPLYSSIT